MTETQERTSPARKIFDIACVVAVAVYTIAFLVRQGGELGNPHFLEWDARGTSLPAWRFHGTGLFGGDLVVDFMEKCYGTPGWKLLYWVGTLFTDPLTLGRLLPYGAFAVVLWHGIAFARSRMGPAGVALTVFLLVHFFCIWARLIGFNSRGFGFPFTVAFVRYVADKNERRALVTLILAAVCYPSVLLLCGPAYALVLALRRDRRAWLRFAVAGALALSLAAVSQLRVDPRIGSPPSYAQAATLRQMQQGGYQPFYPMPPALPSIVRVLDLAFEPSGAPIWPAAQTAAQKNRHVVEAVLLAALLLGAGARLRRLPPILAALPVAGLAMFAVISIAAYRLYLPDRPITFAFPVALALGIPLLVREAAARARGGWPERLLPVAVAAGFLVVAGDGLPRLGNIADWSKHHTPAIDFLATLPPDTLVAAHPETSSFVQTWARRPTLFSASTNTPFYYAYAREIEARMEDFFRAYYARDLGQVRDFARRRGIRYLVVDERDFGRDALARSRWFEPWTSINRQLLAGVRPETLPLAHPPPEAVVFHRFPEIVLDASRL